MSDIMRAMYGADFVKIMHGADAVEAPAKIYIQDKGAARGIPLHIIAGVVAGDIGIPPKADGSPYRHGEMWAGKIILVPAERYRDTHDYFQGHGITGILTDNFGDPSMYGLKVK